MPRLRFPDHSKMSMVRPLSAASRARAMRILFLTNAHNGMSQALYLKLTEQGHQVKLWTFRCENVNRNDVSWR